MLKLSPSKQASCFLTQLHQLNHQKTFCVHNKIKPMYKDYLTTA